LAASGAAILLAAGTKGRRYALPNSRIMMHQPWGQVGYGQVSDLEIEAREMLKSRALLDEIIAKHTGQPIDRISKETERDRYFSPEEAREFNIVDAVLSKSTDAKK
jgi:ATP-dependent Clp protease, protease subunit